MLDEDSLSCEFQLGLWWLDLVKLSKQKSYLENKHYMNGFCTKLVSNKSK